MIKDGRAKLGDFGFAKTIVGDPLEPQKGTVLCTPRFCAPEFLSNINVTTYFNQMTAKCDVFSVGILIFNLIFNSFPWEAAGGNL